MMATLKASAHPPIQSRLWSVVRKFASLMTTEGGAKVPKKFLDW